MEYIEQHIRDELSAEILAAEVGYSVYHFCRLFHLNRGMPLMEYVRRRRLSLASLSLFRGEKVIDIALEFGFGTPGGFAKAFRKEFHYSPSQYQARMAGFFNSADQQQIGAFMMDPQIIKRPGFLVAGYGIQTNLSQARYTRDVASFWSHYEGENLESRLYRILTPPRHGEVGLCIPTSNDGSVSYLLGVIVEDFSKAEPDMIKVEVPAAEYAVFTTPPVDTSNDPEQLEFARLIRETWKYIFEEWFPDSGYYYDEDGYDFEFYDERCHGLPDTVMEIWVPVKS